MIHVATDNAGNTDSIMGGDTDAADKLRKGQSNGLAIQHNDIFYSEAFLQAELLTYQRDSEQDDGHGSTDSSSSPDSDSTDADPSNDFLSPDSLLTVFVVTMDKGDTLGDEHPTERALTDPQSSPQVVNDSLPSFNFSFHTSESTSGRGSWDIALRVRRTETETPTGEVGPDHAKSPSRSPSHSHSQIQIQTQNLAVAPKRYDLSLMLPDPVPSRLTSPQYSSLCL